MQSDRWRIGIYWFRQRREQLICWVGKFLSSREARTSSCLSSFRNFVQKLLDFEKLKMNWLLVAICLGSLSLAFGKGCSTSFQFRAVCHHYLYGESCQPGFEHLCQPTKTTYNNPICPISICVSNYFKYQLGLGLELYSSSENCRKLLWLLLKTRFVYVHSLLWRLLSIIKPQRHG